MVWPSGIDQLPMQVWDELHRMWLDGEKEGFGEIATRDEFGQAISSHLRIWSGIGEPSMQVWRELLRVHRMEGFGEIVSRADDPKPEPQSDVDRVVDALDKRLIGSPDRARLRRSLDKADGPDTSRSGRDGAVGRAIGRMCDGPGLVWKP